MPSIVSSPHLDYVDEVRLTRFHWVLLLGVALAQILDGYDFQITSYALPGFSKEFGLDPGQAGAVAAAGNFGLLIGAIVFSQVADRFGRKPIFQVVLLCYALGSLLSGLAPNYAVLVSARFLAGLGIGAEFPVAFALLAELTPRKWRSKFIPLGPIMYGVGFIVAGLSSIFIILPYSWRWGFLLGVLPALMILYVRAFLPESVRFLVEKSRLDEATRVVQRIARSAGEVFSVPAGSQVTVREQVRVPMRPYMTAVLLLGAMIALRSISDYGVGAFLPTIFASQGYELLRAFAYTLIITGIQPLAQLFGGWFQDRVKERRTALWVTLWVGALLNLGFALTIFFGGPINLAVGFQVLATLIGGAYVAIYYTLGTELFPTSIRSAAVGWETAIGRTGAVIGPLLLGLVASTGLPFGTILTFWYVPAFLAGLIPFLGLRGQTRNRSLEATAQVVAEPAAGRSAVAQDVIPAGGR
ncbi:MAG: MFS transporter [Chloroflexi bacterium]|nr:MFS transporter [Chloroflexota bacterium]MBV9600909.1 MFS transporter [Chloroflexota bacterium]